MLGHPVCEPCKRGHHDRCWEDSDEPAFYDRWDNCSCEDDSHYEDEEEDSERW